MRPNTPTTEIRRPRHDEPSPGLLADGWYTTGEIARLLRVDASSVRRWRTARPPQGPPFVRLSERVVMYGAADVERWLAGRRIDPAQAA
ncbi:helix-turn-helix transcriptional regulator [Streptomyces sp. H39-C1]|uniref:helix-turn-helix transcriptional regulator n=1 Tax=Streptomyces sp. H39-C1 TaxID=3004355 RepID=UPI0022AFF9E9|nr:helix-turn-helix domain-containing protein [Streptomyces sp. H39-C1]MCZ4102284.1 helix-turn-helix domain-containing protein [Streptomyces sp. H39-C1]